jgi:iron complex outermembrane receptor protein/vitamin B12 transporter
MGKTARLFLFVLALSIPTSVFAGPLSGVIADSSGGRLARATVRLIDDAGAVRATTRSDEAGRFTLHIDACDRCVVEASLTGFLTASTPVTAPDARNLVLQPAPVSDSIVVTATREAAPTAQVGASVTVFTAADIARRGSVMLSDLVRETPGVAVIQTGGQGGQTSLFLRGGESTYTKVLLDGIPLNEPGGTFNFGGLSTTNLSRVEVVRGAQSALFGTDAMSGVIQLFTARGSAARHPAFSAAAESGTYGTRRVLGTLSGAARGWDYSIGGTTNVTDNRVPNNRLTSHTLSLSAGGLLTSSIAVRATGRLEDGRVGTPGQTAFGRPDMDAFFDHRDAVAGMSLEQRLSTTWHQRVAYGYTRTRQDSINLQIDAPYVPAYGTATAPFEFSDYPYDSRNLLQRNVLSYQVDGRLNADGRVAQLVTMAADWNGERATLRQRFRVIRSRDPVVG